MKHLNITATCIGNEITSISECLKLSKAYGEEIILNFPNGVKVMIRPNSENLDLIKIYTLESEVLKLKK